jgi:hypothetical protein
VTSSILLGLFTRSFSQLFTDAESVSLLPHEEIDFVHKRLSAANNQRRIYYEDRALALRHLPESTRTPSGQFPKRSPNIPANLDESLRLFEVTRSTPNIFLALTEPETVRPSTPVNTSEILPIVENVAAVEATAGSTSKPAEGHRPSVHVDRCSSDAMRNTGRRLRIRWVF